MLHTLAVGNYRSINNVVMPLGRLNLIVLDKSLGQTAIQGQGMLDEPARHWPD
jgi:predicted ATPase